MVVTVKEDRAVTPTHTKIHDPLVWFCRITRLFVFVRMADNLIIIVFPSPQTLCWTHRFEVDRRDRRERFHGARTAMSHF